ncbi:PA3496 family putative envelope integrity protein [Teredinibacter turnerae]|uniref:PA3496 family putative envelope integrity protein n=1 Tax=Teredinibacter turnerae TaxID=2426 RepID=UPI001E4E204E|nr:hypothetical protein [Teredinibacter turnerae]
MDSSSDLENVILENTLESGIDEDLSTSIPEIDARRKLENKIEELRLLKEVQEFDFDI